MAGAGRKINVVVLCEDSAHFNFASAFMKEFFGKKIHARMVQNFAGQGSMEQFVRESYSKEILANRRRLPERNGLVVLTDGDDVGLSGRLDRLRRQCQVDGVDDRKVGEPVAIFVPCWNIETWLQYAERLGLVQEDVKNYPRRSVSECRRLAKSLAKVCKGAGLPASAPESLLSACEELGERFSDFKT